MILNCSPNSTKSLPAALLLLSAGLLALPCGIAWQHAFAPLFHLSSGPNDFVRGFCIGLGLALEIIALVMLARTSARRLKS
jgi:hypothetical protein